MNKKNFLNFILAALLIGVGGGCWRERLDGVYTGQMSRQTETLTAYKTVSGTVTDEEENLLVVLKREGDSVFIKITGSRLIGDCDLRADVDRKNGAIIRIPQTCSDSMSLQGTLTVGGDNLVFSLNGYSQTFNQWYRFNGYRK